jgi:hypothetical protein
MATMGQSYSMNSRNRTEDNNARRLLLGVYRHRRFYVD